MSINNSKATPSLPFFLVGGIKVNLFIHEELPPPLSWCIPTYILITRWLLE